MITKNRKQIENLYISYGFNKYFEDDNYMIFTFSRGYFRNAEILNMGEETDVLEDLKDELDASGYAFKVEKFVSIKELHNNLFKGFFNSDTYKMRIEKNYKSYTETLTRTLGTEYKYVNCNYSLDGEEFNENVIDQILIELKKEGPVLIIIEAPAGYGKTCTSYELLKRINDEYSEFEIPLLTELSLNRTAKIFKYVLLDEIDRCFSNVDLALVKKEINEGKIPLIIDGLDELITKGQNIRNNSSSNDNILDDVTSMLNTISDLLENKSKIILTSRKSAMFTGEKFNNWLFEEGYKYTVRRIVLREPSIKDWIGNEKVAYLNEHDIDIKNISNPVILSYLRSLEVSDFSKFCCSNEKLINSFFERLLTREIYRQSLKLSVEEQLDIFTKLSIYMATEGFSSDTREMMKDHILLSNIELLEISKKRYSGIEIKDVESIANTLAGHALLDKVGIYEQLSFINDFVFGYLIGCGLITSSKDDIFIDFKYIDLACTAFKDRGLIYKEKLFQILKKSFEAMLGMERILIELNLNSKIMGVYQDESFSELDFVDFKMDKEDSFRNCSFFNCRFIKSEIHKNCFKDTIFMNCTFYDCTFINTDVEKNLNFFECTGDDKYKSLIDKINVIEEIDNYKYERIVIEQFWPKGRAQAQQKRALGKMYQGVNNTEHEYIKEAIENLISKKIIGKYSEILYLNLSQMRQIIEIKNSGGNQ